MILEFYAVPVGTDMDAADAHVVARQHVQVTSLSINSRAIGDVLNAFALTLLAPLVGDARVVARVAYVQRSDFGLLASQAAAMRSRPPQDDALIAVSDAIDDGIGEARPRNADLIVVAS